MEQKIYLYPVWTRVWHGINALLFLVLIFTGINMQYASKETAFLWIRFDHAVEWHNIAAIILVFNYIFYVVFNIISKNFRHYRIKFQGLRTALRKQLRYYVSGIFRNEQHPFPVSIQSKFNPLQKVSYVIVMYFCLPFLIISGLALLFPEIIVRQLFGVSGVLLTDMVHVIMGFILSIFFIIHVYTCTLGRKPGTLFKSIITGYHEVHDE